MVGSTIMQREFLKRARECRFVQAALLEFATELPADDQELHDLIAEAAATADNDAFVHIVFAALAGGRRVDARHLERGASLFNGPHEMAAAAIHCSGDVARALIGAVEGERLGDERAATALVVAALWSKEKGNIAIPPELIIQARIHARRAGHNELVALQLAVLAELVRDEGLLQVLDSEAIPPASAGIVSEFINGLLGAARESV